MKQKPFGLEPRPVRQSQFFGPTPDTNQIL